MSRRCSKPRTNGKPCRHFLTSQGYCPFHDGAGTGARKQNLLRLFLPWLFGIGLLWFMVESGEPEPAVDLALQSRVNAALGHFDTAPEKTIAGLQQLIREYREQPTPDTASLSWLWQQLARQHERRWHWHLAIEAWKHSEQLTPSKALRAHRQQREQWFAELQAERQKQSQYIAYRDAGPARRLQQRVLLANLFVDLTGDEHWGNKERLLALLAQQHVQQWLLKQYPSTSLPELRFSTQSYSAQSAQLTGFHQAYNGKAILASLLLPEHDTSINAFIEKLFDRDDIDHVAVMLHYPKEDRSFAFRCAYANRMHRPANSLPLRAHRCDDEIAVITHQLSHNNWPRVAVTQAHELLHLFGAADLYNVRGAETFATTDVMHYPFPRLLDSNIDPLTAWAIGWQEQIPETPFPVVEH